MNSNWRSRSQRNTKTTGARSKFWMYFKMIISWRPLKGKVRCRYSKISKRVSKIRTSESCSSLSLNSKSFLIHYVITSSKIGSQNTSTLNLFNKWTTNYSKICSRNNSIVQTLSKLKILVKIRRRNQIVSCYRPCNLRVKEKIVGNPPTTGLIKVKAAEEPHLQS